MHSQVAHGKEEREKAHVVCGGVDSLPPSQNLTNFACLICLICLIQREQAYKTDNDDETAGRARRGQGVTHSKSTGRPIWRRACLDILFRRQPSKGVLVIAPVQQKCLTRREPAPGSWVLVPGLLPHASSSRTAVAAIDISIMSTPWLVRHDCIHGGEEPRMNACLCDGQARKDTDQGGQHSVRIHPTGRSARGEGLEQAFFHSFLFF